MLGQLGKPPKFNEIALSNHEALLFQGGIPEAFTILPTQLKELLVNGENTLAIQVHNRNVNSSDLSGNFFFSFAINNTSQNYSTVPSWFTEPFSSSNLPLLMINTLGRDIPNEPKMTAQMGIVDNGPGERNHIGDSFNDYDGAIGIEIRGSSSTTFPKKNYGIETQDANGSNNNVSLLGMPEENDWVLHGPYADKSLLRNVLAYYIGRSMDRYAPRTRLCELLINNQYRGVYVLTERIKRDPNRVDIANLRPQDIAGDELTGGYIIQVDRDDPGISDGWWAGTPSVFYKFDDPDHDEIRPEQKGYIQNFIRELEQVMSAPGIENTYSQYIDLASFVDYWIATEIGKHIDAYKLSFFMHKKKVSNGDKLHLGPLWDFNLAYGNFDFARDPGPEGWAYKWGDSGANHPFWIRKVMSIQEVQNTANCRWKALREGPLHTDSLMQFIDDRVALMTEARERNFNQWQILGRYVWPNSFVGVTYEDEVNFLKDWLQDRLDWMDLNMLGTCSTVQTTNYAKEHVHFRLYPNPFQTTATAIFKSETYSYGRVIFYNVLGQEVATYDLQSGRNELITPC